MNRKLITVEFVSDGFRRGAGDHALNRRRLFDRDVLGPIRSGGSPLFRWPAAASSSPLGDAAAQHFTDFFVAGSLGPFAASWLSYSLAVRNIILIRNAAEISDGPILRKSNSYH
jgi:hypothetical protein